MEDNNNNTHKNNFDSKDFNTIKIHIDRNPLESTVANLISLLKPDSSSEVKNEVLKVLN